MSVSVNDLGKAQRLLHKLETERKRHECLMAASFVHIEYGAGNSQNEHMHSRYIEQDKEEYPFDEMVTAIEQFILKRINALNAELIAIGITIS